MKEIERHAFCRFSVEILIEGVYRAAHEDNGPLTYLCSHRLMARFKGHEFRTRSNESNRLLIVETGTNDPRLQRDSTLSIIGDELDQRDRSCQSDSLTHLRLPTALASSYIQKNFFFGRFARFFLHRRQEKLGPRMHPQQGV
jgi:hypothetical protein